LGYDLPPVPDDPDCDSEKERQSAKKLGEAGGKAMDQCCSIRTEVVASRFASAMLYALSFDTDTMEVQKGQGDGRCWRTRDNAFIFLELSLGQVPCDNWRNRGNFMEFLQYVSRSAADGGGLAASSVVEAGERRCGVIVYEEKLGDLYVGRLLIPFDFYHLSFKVLVRAGIGRGGTQANQGQEKTDSGEQLLPELLDDPRAEVRRLQTILQGIADTIQYG
jgi:hypothetical protein